MAETVSIAMATYNGARFLPEQLASLAAQTRLPDELVVGDDGSSDATVALLEAFAATAPFPVRIERNARNLGHAANFAAIIARCRGAVVCPCDQDDIWEPGKIAAVLAARAAQPGRLLLTHDAALVNEAGTPLGLTIGGQIARAGGVPARDLVAGCCMALDARLAQLFAAAPRTRTHDAWIAAIADGLDLRGFIDQPLIRYRRHGRNATTSYMSAERSAGRLARWRDRAAKALAEPAGEALEWAAASRRSALAAVAEQGGGLAEVVPAARLEQWRKGVAGTLARDERRLAVHKASGLRRWRAIGTNLARGDYRGQAGTISLLRDALDPLIGPNLRRTGQ